MRFLKKLYIILYHYYQYSIKANKNHKKIIACTKESLVKLKLVRATKGNCYFFSVLRTLNPFVFEELFLLCFLNKGYQIKRNSRYTGDGGIDGIIFSPLGRQVISQEYSKNSILTSLVVML